MRFYRTSYAHSPWHRRLQPQASAASLPAYISRPRYLVLLGLGLLLALCVSPVRAKAQVRVAEKGRTLSEIGSAPALTPASVQNPASAAQARSIPANADSIGVSSDRTDADGGMGPMAAYNNEAYEEPGPGVPHAFVVLPAITIAPEYDPLAEAHFRRTRYHVRKVYPYALEALKQLATLDSISAHADRKRDVRRHRKATQKELEARFKEDLKKLSRRQGRILLDMLERQTGEPFFYTLKDIKSGTTAFFWQTLAKRFDYDLKDGYDAAADPMLEALLQDLEWPALVYRNPATALSASR
jgi:hypothetical protein